jgi:hypothetical protein
MVSTTINRVPDHTAEAINRRIQQETESRIWQCAANPTGIDRRLQELDREWDIERLLETNASSLAFAGIVLGATVDKRWLAPPAIVTAFLFQHVQGWCPPIPILRRLGYRTAREIEIERVALKYLRRDFGTGESVSIDNKGRAHRALQAAEA